MRDVGNQCWLARQYNMRIAYIAPYQGPSLVKTRPCVRNYSLGGKTKIELIAELLRSASHDVDVLSQGEVVEQRFKFYPAMTERQPFHPEIPVHYSSALPVRFFNGWWSSFSTLNCFKARHKAFPYDLVLIYNLKPPQVACANYAIRRLGLPVILEYEDDQFVTDSGGHLNQFTSGLYLSAAKRLLASLSGCIGVSPYLLSQTPPAIPKLLLRGVVGNEITQLR
jgi:hypothetical protein